MSTKTAAQILSDLDRCEHGRHVADACNNCIANGYDLNGGNPAIDVLRAALEVEAAAGDQEVTDAFDHLHRAIGRYALAGMGNDGIEIGYDISGRPLIDPGTGRNDPDAWTALGRAQNGGPA